MHCTSLEPGARAARAAALAGAALLVLAPGCGPGGGAGEWEPAFDATDTGWIMNVGGTTQDDLFAVGGNPDQGVVVHYDGNEWRKMELPDGVPLLNWVHAFAPDDVLAAGNGGTVLHYDGSSWSRQETPVDNDLWGVWGASQGDVWAVGGRGFSEEQKTILRWDGSQWQEVPIPELERPRVNAFFKVWGTGPDNVYIVGQQGVVLHWDGSELTEELVGANRDLIALWGTGPDNIVLVGGRSNGIVSHWDGESWTTESLSPLPGINGVWMREPGVAHLAGVGGTLATLDVETLEYETAEVDARLDFHAIFSGGGSLTAVGGNIGLGPPFMGQAWSRKLGSDE